MFLKFAIFILFSVYLYAGNTLKNTYYIDTNDINISTIVPDVKKDFVLFKIEAGRYTKRIKSVNLLQILKSHGYDSCIADSSYVKFIKKSPIDTSKIELSLKEFYTNIYNDINIKTIRIIPRGYIDSLPNNYTVNVPNKSYLSNKGTINIKTINKRKIFFDYIIFAKISVYIAKKKIKKDVELSPINVAKNSIMLDKFRAMPIQNMRKGSMQSKQHIKQHTILTIRDVEPLSIVKRNSSVSVTLNNKNIAIQFAAKALQDGKINDIITVQRRDGKRIKARVIGKNKVEMR